MKLEAEWARCSDWVQAALDRAPPTHTLDDVLGLIKRGDAQFWPFAKSVCVTQIFREPLAATLNHWLVGGDLDDLMSHQHEVETWAKAQGCSRLMLGGRNGWTRVLNNYGFSPVGIVLAKELT